MCVRSIDMCFNLSARLPSVPFTPCEKYIFHFLTEIQTQVADKSSTFVGIIPLKATLNHMKKVRFATPHVETYTLLSTFQTSQTQIEEESSVASPQKAFKKTPEGKEMWKCSTPKHSFHNRHQRPWSTRNIISGGIWLDVAKQIEFEAESMDSLKVRQ